MTFKKVFFRAVASVLFFIGAVFNAEAKEAVGTPANTIFELNIL